MVNQDDRYYTTKELAIEYKVTRQAIWKWISNGRINSVRVGHVYRVKGSEWFRFLNDEVGN